VSGAVYRLDGVTKLHGTRTVLDLPQFEVACGEVLCLVGPPGARQFIQAFHCLLLHRYIGFDVLLRCLGTFMAQPMRAPSDACAPECVNIEDTKVNLMMAEGDVYLNRERTEWVRFSYLRPSALVVGNGPHRPARERPLQLALWACPVRT